jgi:hypothetical protein
MAGSEPCHTCAALTACRQAVKAGDKIACEDRPHRTRVKPIFTPGQLFTTADLMAITGQDLNTAGTWCRYHRATGDIELVAVKNNWKVYRFIGP